MTVLPLNNVVSALVRGGGTSIGGGGGCAALLTVTVSAQILKKPISKKLIIRHKKTLR